MKRWKKNLLVLALLSFAVIFAKMLKKVRRPKFFLCSGKMSFFKI